jgi:hypothetical protein
VASPAFAVPRRCEQPIDQPLPGVGRVIVNERGDFIGRWRQADRKYAREPAWFWQPRTRSRVEAELYEQEGVDCD